MATAKQSKPKKAASTKPLTKKGFRGIPHVAPKGNQYAAGKHKTPVTARSNFITQQLIAKLNDKYVDRTGPRAKKTTQSCYVKMVDTLVEMACAGDMQAISFIYERVEGKVTQPVSGKVDHVHRIEEAIENLSDAELAQLEHISRKLLEGQGIQVIEGTAEEVVS